MRQTERRRTGDLWKKGMFILRKGQKKKVRILLSSYALRRKSASLRESERELEREMRRLSAEGLDELVEDGILRKIERR